MKTVLYPKLFFTNLGRLITMGYILPVTQYQYNDYQNRINDDRRIPNYVEKPFKVVLERQHQEIKKEYERFHHPYQIDQLPPGTLGKQRSEELYGNITGKGKHFSKSV